MWIIAGRYAHPHDEGIHVFEIDEKLLLFKKIFGIKGILNPSWICLRESGKKLYAVSENKDGALSGLYIYNVDLLNKRSEVEEIISFGGSASCHVTINKTGTIAFITNYNSGSLTIIDLVEKEINERLIYEYKFSGSSIDPDRQNGPHPHCTVLSEDEKFLYCSDLGTDSIYVFKLLYNDGKCESIFMENTINLPLGSGPRILQISGNHLYVITELSGEINIIDLKTNIIISRNSMSFGESPEGGDIRINNSGNRIYATNRGADNSIYIYEIPTLGHDIKLIQKISSFGKSPRHLILVEKYGLFLVSNEQSNSITIFRIQPDGSLKFTTTITDISSPTCLQADYKIGN